MPKMNVGFLLGEEKPTYKLVLVLYLWKSTSTHSFFGWVHKKHLPKLRRDLDLVVPSQRSYDLLVMEKSTTMPTPLSQELPSSLAQVRILSLPSSHCPFSIGHTTFLFPGIPQAPQSPNSSPRGSPGNTAPGPGWKRVQLSCNNWVLPFPTEVPHPRLTLLSGTRREGVTVSQCRM